MGLAFAASAAVLALVGTWRRLPLAATLARLGAPTAVLAGWWYVANVVRYGDLSGSEALLHKFLRQPSGSLVSNLRDNTIWESALRTITTRRTDAPLATDPVLWFRLAEVVTVVGVVATIVLVVTDRRARRQAPPRARAGGPPLPARAWAASGALALVPLVLTAQHTAGGGNPHPRYLLPAVPVLATAVALPLVRLTRCWGAVVLLVALAVLTTVQARASIQDLEANPLGPPGTPLAESAGAPWVQGVGLGAAGLGLVLLVVALARLGRPAAHHG